MPRLSTATQYSLSQHFSKPSSPPTGQNETVGNRATVGYIASAHLGASASLHIRLAQEGNKCCGEIRRNLRNMSGELRTGEKYRKFLTNVLIFRERSRKCTSRRRVVFVSISCRTHEDSLRVSLAVWRTRRQGIPKDAVQTILKEINVKSIRVSKVLILTHTARRAGWGME